MPVQYLTPSELLEMPVGVAMASQINALPVGMLDKMLFRASQRCNSYCQKRLQSPATTTLSALATAGQTSISVTSTLSIDNQAENALILELGTGNQEIVLIQPGGVAVTAPPVSPYPGTITLAAPLQFSHSSGAPVQYCFQEVEEAGSASSGDPWTEALQTQTAQLALAHLPAYHAGLTRIVFTKSYPIQTIYQIQHAYPFDITYNQIPVSTAIIQATAGYYRFIVGEVILFQGMMQTTYTGGYQHVPDDIKEAAAFYFADAMTPFTVPVPVYSHTRGRQSQTLIQQGISAAVRQAEVILEQYRRLT